MPSEDDTLTRADDETIAWLVSEAKSRLIVIAPALREPVVRAIAERWSALGAKNVSVILDTDPENFRLGYGDLASLEILEQTARQVGSNLRRNPGIEIGIVVSDSRTLVYSPLPPTLASQGDPSRTNGLLLHQAVFEPLNPARQNGAAETPPLSDEECITASAIKQAREELAANPPQDFSAQERVRVFNAFFEFVELELLGTAIERKTVPIPLGLANSDDLRQRMRTSFRLVGEAEKEKLSGRHLLDARTKLVKEHLITLAGYGSVVLRTVKPAFMAQVKELEAKVDAFKKAVEQNLQKAMDHNRQDLVKVLLPSVRNNPPHEWKRYGLNLDGDAMGQLLDRAICRAFGTAKHLVGDMKVKCVFKGVTYELLSDKKFLEVAVKAIPSLPKLHVEFDALKTPDLSENPAGRSLDNSQRSCPPAPSGRSGG